jgi:CRP/FNR family transcriptional regulator, cyclic AMP receptor protein
MYITLNTLEQFAPIMPPCIACPLLKDRVFCKVAEMLSDIYHATCREVRYLGLASSAAEKFARFLLDLKTTKSPDAHGDKVFLTMTHDEIAGMLSTSRETVSRLFTDFKRRHIIDAHGATLIVTNRQFLQDLVGD